MIDWEKRRVELFDLWFHERQRTFEEMIDKIVEQEKEMISQKEDEKELIECYNRVEKGETTWIKFGNTCIVDNNHYHEMLKREWKMDDEMIVELKILRGKINKIKDIL